MGGTANIFMGQPTAIDTCLHTQQSRHNLERELKRADVVIVTVSYDKPTSFDRLISFWLPELRRLKVKISLAFFHACLTSVCPLSPLFDKETQTLRPRVVNAFKHIFMVCDRDWDGALSDAELIYLQIRCSGCSTSPSPAQIASYKKDVLEEEPEEVNERGVTLAGYLAIQVRLIKRWWTAHPWRDLNRFGFNSDFILAHDQLPVLLRGAIDQSSELTDKAVEFLKLTFSLLDIDTKFELTNKAVEYLKSTISLFDLDKDGALQPAELDKLFSTAPESPWDEVPYKNAGESTQLGGMSLDGFLSKWALKTLLEPSKSLANLIYIGYRKDPASAFHITKRKGFDCKKEGFQRNVFQCFVFGLKNVGKSELLNAFLGRPFLGSYSSTIKERFAVKCVDYVLGTRKTLVLREIPEDEVRYLVSDKESLAACDVAIFIYDSSEKSWNKATDLLIEVASHAKDSGLKVPILIVTAKDNLDLCGTALKELTQASRQMGLRAPIPVSTKFGDLNDLLDTIVSTAEQPQLSIPVTEAWKISKTENLNDGFDRIKHSAKQPRLSTCPTRSLNNSILGVIKNVFSKIISRIPNVKAWRDPRRYYVKLGDVVLDDPDHEKPHQC
ncbi:hypothetical protein GIB67_023052 [Kingdonia uniflora]|uniref:Mitochondrial Rho GTPase n=1 Tax=Kingdonia uniflora TaxID=39325 RepID=A0A7J7LBA8_9MAGN|nr:hypothetical protein GIB67_023052 [Kingdonia uniflora]